MPSHIDYNTANRSAQEGENRTLSLEVAFLLVLAMPDIW